MLTHKPRGLRLVIVAALVLRACAPVSGTPEMIGATQAATNVPAVTAAPSQAAAVTAPPPTTAALSLKSKDSSTLTYLNLNDPFTLDPALDYDT